jgi:mono/diheme cytochrome c family protein
VNRVGAKRRISRNLAAIALLVTLMRTQSPATSATGEAEAGWQLARRWCAGCHVVDMAGYGTDSAPAFATVARERTDRRWIRAWLESPHPPMPNMNLSRGEIDDVIAYLDTLAKH